MEKGPFLLLHNLCKFVRSPKIGSRFAGGERAKDTGHFQLRLADFIEETLFNYFLKRSKYVAFSFFGVITCFIDTLVQGPIIHGAISP